MFLFTQKLKEQYSTLWHPLQHKVLKGPPPPSPRPLFLCPPCCVCLSVWRKRIVVLCAISTPLLNTRAETHCSTLHDTSRHSKTLHDTARHCNSLQLTATHCYSVLLTATHCNTTYSLRLIASSLIPGLINQSIT